MTYSPLIGPIVALVAWSLVMMVWMAAVRFPALRKAGIDLKQARGGRGQDLDGKLPPEANWAGHNYAHLMEQPTIFYAITVALILMHQDQPINVSLAWGYVGLRIVHSIVQATSNQLRFRMPLFLMSSLCLIGLTIHAGAAWMHG